MAQAKEAAGDETDPWKVAVALEAYVHRAVTMKDFSQALATASEVARNREGDCKGHAVYLAALARARKIPARVAIGLVYMPQSQTFGYHMWTEVYVAGRWIGLDGTLAKGGIGGGHLQLTHSPLAGAAAYNSLLPGHAGRRTAKGGGARLGMKDLYQDRRHGRNRPARRRPRAQRCHGHRSLRNRR